MPSNTRESRSKTEISPHPTTNDFATNDWDLAGEMQELFDGDQTILEESVGANIIFFRTPDTDEWGTLPSERRSEMKEFSLEYIDELINRVDPSVILTIGLGTFDTVASRLDQDRETIASRETSRLVTRSSGDGPTILGALHLTGARISNSDQEKTYQHLKQELSEELPEFTE